VSADILVRLPSLLIPVSRRRVQATNSILLSVAIQPLAVLVAVVYLMLFNLFSTSTKLSFRFHYRLATSPPASAGSRPLCPG
jgi:hypothetical protein